eukprot:18222-Heterococcus_DN1.PRE.1
MCCGFSGMGHLCPGDMAVLLNQLCKGGLTGLLVEEQLCKGGLTGFMSVTAALCSAVQDIELLCT